MARWRRLAGGVPERLARFVPSEWPDAACAHEALSLWELACIAWLKDAEGRSLPFGEHGDVIDVLNYAERHERHRGPCPGNHRRLEHSCAGTGCYGMLEATQVLWLAAGDSPSRPPASEGEVVLVADVFDDSRSRPLGPDWLPAGDPRLGGWPDAAGVAAERAVPLLAAEQATAGSNGPAAAGKVKGLAHEAPPEPSPDDHVQKGMAWGLVNGELHCYDGEGAMIS